MISIQKPLKHLVNNIGAEPKRADSDTQCLHDIILVTNVSDRFDVVYKMIFYDDSDGKKILLLNPIRKINGDCDE